MLSKFCLLTILIILISIKSSAQPYVIDTTAAIDSSYDMVFSKAEVDASFPGGNDAWMKYVSKNTNQEALKRNNVPPGKYIVAVQFMVDRNGNVSRVQPLSHKGKGLDVEAVRLVKDGPRWNPGVQNGRQIKIWHLEKIPIEVL